MMGVMADAGFRDVGMLDYVDRFTRAEAGSPVRDIKDFPLKMLFNVDNSCREAYGFIASGLEPQLCPRDEPTPEPGMTGRSLASRRRIARATFTSGTRDSASVWPPPGRSFNPHPTLRSLTFGEHKEQVAFTK